MGGRLTEVRSALRGRFILPPPAKRSPPGTSGYQVPGRLSDVSPKTPPACRGDTAPGLGRTEGGSREAEAQSAHRGPVEPTMSRKSKADLDLPDIPAMARLKRDQKWVA